MFYGPSVFELMGYPELDGFRYVDCRNRHRDDGEFADQFGYWLELPF